MADSRLWIRCAYCGEGITIFKYLPSVSFEQLNHENSTILAFLKKHVREREQAGWHYDTNLDGVPGFEVTTDNPATVTDQLFINGEPLWDGAFPLR